MTKGRLEAFSDGVIAILITIMVLELRIEGDSAGLDALQGLLPKFLMYVLSFVFVGIYWNNHHHMFHAADHVSGGVLWANLHLLFWLSVIPLVTGWMGEHHRVPIPTATYGVVMLACGIAYTVLQRVLIARQGPHSKLARAVGSDGKGKLSLLLYVAAIPLASVDPAVSQAIYVIVALLWLVPDRRIEVALSH